MRFKNSLFALTVAATLCSPLSLLAQSSDDQSAQIVASAPGYNLSAAPVVAPIPLDQGGSVTPQVLGYHLLANQKPVVTTATSYAYGQKQYERIELGQVAILDHLLRIISAGGYDLGKTFFEVIEVTGPQQTPKLRPVVIVDYSEVGLAAGAAPNFVGRAIVNKNDLKGIRSRLAAADEKIKSLIRIKHGNHAYNALEFDAAKLMVGDQIGVSQKNPTLPVKD